MEGRTTLQSLPYFDRFDYVANLFQEHAYCLTLEALVQKMTPLTTSIQLFRLLFDEVSRLLNHLLTLSATSLDLGVMGPIFWAFEEREALMEVCERASGARMHTALYRPYEIDATVLTGELLRDLTTFLGRCSRSLAGAFLGLLNNRSFKSRLSFIGQISSTQVATYGITGLIARSAGWMTDLRMQTFNGGLGGMYRTFSLRVFLGRRGDNFDRFMLRVKEAAESFKLIAQVLTGLTGGSVHGQGGRGLGGVSLSLNIFEWRDGVGVLVFFYGSGDQNLQQSVGALSVQNARMARLWHLSRLEGWGARGKFVSMEALISHFQLASGGHALLPGVVYRAVESPKGEVGVSLISAGLGKPLRVKLRTPVSHNMHLIPTIGVGVTFADFVATFCSLDIVMGEIDR
jgi:NADH-quinone oxidoreductase subunit D